MKQNNQVTRRGIGGMSYNVYCVYSKPDHKMLWSLGTHSKSLASLQQHKESTADVVIGSISMALGFLLVIAIGSLL